MLIELSPSDIKFMQDSISCRFQDGRSVNLTITKILAKQINVEDLPTIRVVNRSDTYYSFDNRRLYVYRVLHNKKVLHRVVVKLAPIRMFQPRKFTTKNNGQSVIVRGDFTLKHFASEDTASARLEQVEHGSNVAAETSSKKPSRVAADSERLHLNTSTAQRTSSSDHRPSYYSGLASTTRAAALFSSSSFSKYSYPLPSRSNLESTRKKHESIRSDAVTREKTIEAHVRPQTSNSFRNSPGLPSSLRPVSSSFAYFTERPSASSSSSFKASGTIGCREKTVAKRLGENGFFLPKQEDVHNFQDTSKRAVTDTSQSKVPVYQTTNDVSSKSRALMDENLKKFESTGLASGGADRSIFTNLQQNTKTANRFNEFSSRINELKAEMSNIRKTSQKWSPTSAAGTSSNDNGDDIFGDQQYNPSARHHKISSESNRVTTYKLPLTLKNSQKQEESDSDSSSNWSTTCQVGGRRKKSRNLCEVQALYNSTLSEQKSSPETLKSSTATSSVSKTEKYFLPSWEYVELNLNRPRTLSTTAALIHQD